MTARPVNELVDPGWANAPEPGTDQVTQLGPVLGTNSAAGRRCPPGGPNRLGGFTFAIVGGRGLGRGAGPSPTRGHAVGLSFSVAPEVRPLPRSLANIFEEYTADLGH